MSIFDLVKRDFTTEEEISRGFHAQSLLEDEVFIDAMNGARLDSIQRMLSTEVDQDKERTAEWAMYHAFEEVRIKIRAIRDAGEIAKKRLEDESLRDS